MDRRYQVFISSTFTDLIEERKEVIQALLELDCLPAGMEMFPSANDDQWTLIKKVIDQSDFYVVVVGGRYGSMSEHGISYTEMEYDHAVQKGIPILGFVHADPGSIQMNKSESDVAARKLLAKFKDKVQTRHIKTYNGAEDLGSKVSRALNIAMRTTDAEGWVRGRFAMTPEVQAEMAELRAQVSELNREVAATTKIVVDPDVESGTDTYPIDMTLEYFTDEELTKPRYQRKPASKRIFIDVTWDEVLSHMGTKLMHEATGEELSKELDTFSTICLMQNHRELIPDDYSEPKSLTAFFSCIDDVTVQLFTLGLIQRGVKRRGINDLNKYWVLTDEGESSFMKLRARRRTAEAHS